MAAPLNGGVRPVSFLGVSMKTIFRRFADVRDQIQDADLLLWRHPKAIAHEKGAKRLDLSRVNLVRVDLRGLDLEEADLSGANLTRSNLTEVNLKGADFQEASLSGADLTLVELIRTLSAYQIACGGHGLTIDDWDILVPARSPVGVK
jgi:uncharacterized protein YjbI with pentapeptide repeats